MRQIEIWAEEFVTFLCIRAIMRAFHIKVREFEDA